MNRDAVLRRIEKLEASLAESSGCRDFLAGLGDLELLELAAEALEQGGILDNPLCVEGETECECLREAEEVVGLDSLSRKRAAHRLHSDQEVNVACLYLLPGCDCRNIAAAALDDSRPDRIGYEAGLLHGASAKRTPGDSPGQRPSDALL